MLLSPPTFTFNQPSSSTALAVPASKRRCINPVLSASRALHTITATLPNDTLPSTMLFGAPLQMPLSPPMEGTASLPRRRALRTRQVEEDRGGKRRKMSEGSKRELKCEGDKENKENKRPRALFATPEQRLPSEVPRGLTRTAFAQAFEPTRPRGWSAQDDQDLIALVASTLASALPSQPPPDDSYTISTAPSTPRSSSRKRRRED